MDHPASPYQRLRASLVALDRDESGQGMTEYIIILVSIAVVCVAIASLFGRKIKGFWDDANAEVETFLVPGAQLRPRGGGCQDPFAIL